MKQLSKEHLRKLTDAWQAWAKKPESDSQRRSRDRLHLVFLCIRYGALRLSEALALNDLKDFDWPTCTIKVRGSREREIQVPEKAMEQIRAICEAPRMIRLRGAIARLDQGYVRKKFYEFAESCGLERGLVGPQVVRHSRGSELLQDNIPLSIVQKFLGQRSPVQAAGFVSFSDDDARRIVHNHLRQEALKRTSARNAFSGTVARLETGEVSARVELCTLQGMKINVLVTIESVQRLGLAEGQLLAATVKAPFVMLDCEREAMDGVNRFSGTITSVNRGDVESSVVVDVDGGGATLCSILSTDELDGLGLGEGDRASVFFSPFAAVLSLPEE